MNPLSSDWCDCNIAAVTDPLHKQSVSVCWDDLAWAFHQQCFPLPSGLHREYPRVPR